MATRRQFVQCATAAAAAAILPAADAAVPVTAAPAWKSGDWPWWRGPLHNGTAESGQQVPQSWSAESGIVWRTAVPGRSHGSPIVVDDQVVVEIADSELCLDRRTGSRVWESVIHEGGLDVKGNKKSSMASGSAACDGERFFVNFLNGDSVYLTCVDRKGKQQWQVPVSAYVNHQGFGASPLLWEDLVYSVADNKGGGAIIAASRETGEVVWKRERPAVPNYSSPVIFDVGGRVQLFLTGCDLVTSLNPLTGEVLWEIPGATTECVTTTVTDGRHIYTSGGYPRNHVAAVAADGSGKIVWENGSRTYVPSMLIHEGTLFAVLDAGVAMCWDSASGEELWKGRIGGTFSGSPVLVNDQIHVTDESGRTTIFRASRDAFEVLAQNQLGDEVFATPAICGNRIYTRIAETKDEQRQEYIGAIGS